MENSHRKEKGSVVHESHEHTLLHHYVENGSTKERCDQCNKEIYGVVYACEVCKFIRHGSCAEEWMPAEITHPSHSMHKLKLLNKASDFLCEICFSNSQGARYHCYTCLIDVDLACVSSTQGDQVQIPEGRESKRTRHFSHGQPLAFFKYRKTTQQYELDCSWCDKRLSGMSFGCFQGGLYGCKFFLHKSCISKISYRLQHPFHPLHYLYVQYREPNNRLSCKACKRSIYAYKVTAYYACHECRFYLHISCARLRPTLKHKCHEHDLTYFSRITELNYMKWFKCNACGLAFNSKKKNEDAFYRCVRCNFNIHFKCLPAPAVAKHRYHRHFLVLHHGFTEDDSGEYYCDICETETNPKHYIYYCKKCTYIAHVECVLKEVSDSELRKMMDLVKRVGRSNGKFPKLKETGGNNIDRNQLFEMQEIQFLLKDLEEEEKEKKKEKKKYFEKDEDAETSTSREKMEEIVKVENTEDMISRHPLKTSEKPVVSLLSFEMQINHFSHHHQLNLFRLIKKYENGNCNACEQELHGTVYICTTCKFPFHYGLHKACTELPYELQHPFHSQHSLSLLSQFPHSKTRFFLCDECRNFSSGFVYLCMDCHFKLDVKCAVLVAPKIESQEPKNREKETKLLHFSHEHMLVLGNLSDISASCLGCELPILGPAYCCLDCLHTIHESCLRMLPQEMQHPFHPQHPLIAFPKYSRDTKCHACKLKFRLGLSERNFIRYGCLQCELDFHFVCTNSLRKVLKSDSHEHNLYYFGRENQKFIERFGEIEKVYFKCSTCSEMCNGPFYRCVECAINFHLKCVPIPQKIKSKCHLHHLILKESFVEDESGEYYCDVCEEKRYPKDHVYYCEECHGLFAAHIECGLSMVSDSELRKMMELVKRVGWSNGKFPKLKETGGNNIDRNELSEILMFVKRILEMEELPLPMDMNRFFKMGELPLPTDMSQFFKMAPIFMDLLKMQELQLMMKGNRSDALGKSLHLLKNLEKDETSEEEKEEESDEEENDKEETSEEKKFKNKDEKHEKEDEEKAGDEEKMEEEEEEVIEEKEENSDEVEQDDKSENQDKEKKNEANEGEASTFINGTEDMNRHP